MRPISSINARAGGLLGTLGHEAPRDAGLDGYHRECVRDNVMELSRDTYPLLSDLLSAALGLRGLLTPFLLRNAGLISAPCRHRIPHKPRGSQRHEAFDC